MFGLRDPVSNKHYHKRLSLMFNCAPELIDRLFKLCTPKTCTHEHEPCEGNCPGYGSRTRLSQVYPPAFCKAFSDCLRGHIINTAHVVEDMTQESLVCELTQSLNAGEVQNLHAWLTRKPSGKLSTEEHERLLIPEECRKSIAITNSKLRHFMTFADRLPQGTEYLLTQDSGSIVKSLIALTGLMRAYLLPNSSFTHASVLRGIYGIRISMSIQTHLLLSSCGGRERRKSKLDP